MTAHVIDIKPVKSELPVLHKKQHALVYRWFCSCRERGPECMNARSARTGGRRHIAEMERGK